MSPHFIIEGDPGRKLFPHEQNLGLKLLKQPSAETAHLQAKAFAKTRRVTLIEQADDKGGPCLALPTRYP